MFIPKAFVAKRKGNLTTVRVQNDARKGREKGKAIRTRGNDVLPSCSGK